MDTFDYRKWFAILETGIVKGSMYITNIYTNFTIIYGWMTGYFKKTPSILIWVKILTNAIRISMPPLPSITFILPIFNFPNPFQPSEPKIIH
jgi:hypothetical protein